MKDGSKRPDRSPSVENLRHLRLLALLRDLVESNGRVKSAEILGVSYRTLARAADSGRLTGRMADALENHLLREVGPSTKEWIGRAAELEKRVEALGREVSGMKETLRSEMEALRTDVAGALESVERRIAAFGSKRPAALPESETDLPPPLPRAMQEKMVVLASEQDDEQLFGAAAHLVREWRAAREVFRATEERLPRVEAELRLLEIEIELIGTYELTLPPADYPWDKFDLEDEKLRRERRMAVAHVVRRRALLRRFLRRVCTLGIRR